MASLGRTRYMSNRLTKMWKHHQKDPDQFTIQASIWMSIRLDELDNYIREVEEFWYYHTQHNWRDGR